MHKSRFCAGIALLALSASGCGLAAASNGEDIMVPAEPTLIDFVDPATVVGLSTATLTEGDATSGRYVHIKYPVLAGASALNRALKARAERQLKEFRRATGGNAPILPKPELNVDWQLAAASPDAVGVRLRTGEFLGTSWGNSTRTYWFDPHTGKAAGSTGLLAGKPALERLAALVKEALADRGGQVERSRVTADAGLFDSMAFNRNGDLVVEFDDCEVGRCSLGRVAVAIPAQQAAPLLSELGRRAQRAARDAARRSAAPEVPSFTPTSSPDAVSSRAGGVDCRVRKCVALTFDDGPGPYTGRLLNILAEHRARATFFALGGSVSAEPALIRRMSMEGHLVGNHSWSHKDLSKQPSSKVADSLGKTSDAVSEVIGQRPSLVRPPYGAVNPQVRDVAREMGCAVVTWDVDSEDESAKDAAEIADRVVHAAHPGAIILMHDIHRETVDAVPDILRRLRGNGYTFVTVPELYGPVGMQAGRMYRSGNELPGKQPLT
ncbi:polysaccharide deacetylase family protein [Nonomuraea sp. NPDC049309]|uniref:polysaccharide deacetylase family protein n=1 Tax=Nonomuraea sp. NPDC049309 TaxID=3364350 RepID=UPI0037192C61